MIATARKPAELRDPADLGELLQELGQSIRELRLALACLEGLGLAFTPGLVEAAHRVTVVWSMLEARMTMGLRTVQ